MSAGGISKSKSRELARSPDRRLQAFVSCGAKWKVEAKEEEKLPLPPPPPWPPLASSYGFSADTAGSPNHGFLDGPAEEELV